MNKKMNKIVGKIAVLLMMLIVMGTVALPVYAADGDKTEVSAEVDTNNSTGDKAIAAGIAIGLAAGAGAVGMGVAIGKSVEGISRQPEAEGKIRTSLMLGLVFVETAIIYALIVAILIIFVL